MERGNGRGWVRPEAGDLGCDVAAMVQERDEAGVGDGAIGLGPVAHAEHGRQRLDVVGRSGQERPLVAQPVGVAEHAQVSWRVSLGVERDEDIGIFPE